MKKHVLWLSAALCLPVSSAFALTQTGQFNVSIIILKQCAISAPAAIVLNSVGASSLVSTTSSATQPFTVTCSAGTGYTIGFASTNDVSVGSATHQMKGLTAGNTNVVQYQLFDVTANASNTAALSASSSVITDTGTGSVQTKTLKAQVANYTAPVMPDSYIDTVTMTITY